MTVLKCAMCGGNLIAEAGGKYGTCDYCGSVSSLPKTTDEQQVNLFNRANHLRRQNEFDKAIIAYENLLGIDDTDAEAHWGVLLSRYGIEYIDDPAGGSKIPTCHRVQTTPIQHDADYKAALEYAPDDYTRSLYKKQAQRIAEIQKQILAVSQNESPYDIFICYKQSSSDGSRTKDSIIAQDIYTKLTVEGYRTFFAEISLEDRVGEQYEPIIFAALNSSKVMLVIGTCAENLNAVWVKNEWSRFLSLMKTDRNKLLIPCYRDMNPYDLPEEFSMLQAQDVGKIAFMHDLLRGVGKIVSSRKAPKGTAAVASTATYIERAELFLKGQEWDKATQYCEKILDVEPHNAKAYFLELLAVFKCKDESDLLKLSFESEDKLRNEFCVHPLLNNALNFADEQFEAKIRGYVEHVVANTAERECNAICEQAMVCLNNKAYRDALHLLDSAKKYSDSAQFTKANENICSTVYKLATEYVKYEQYSEALNLLPLIRGYRDSDKLIEKCDSKIKAIARGKGSWHLIVSIFFLLLSAVLFKVITSTANDLENGFLLRLLALLSQFMFGLFGIKNAIKASEYCAGYRKLLIFMRLLHIACIVWGAVTLIIKMEQMGLFPLATIFLMSGTMAFLFGMIKRKKMK